MLRLLAPRSTGLLRPRMAVPVSRPALTFLHTAQTSHISIPQKAIFSTKPMSQMFRPVNSGQSSRSFSSSVPRQSSVPATAARLDVTSPPIPETASVKGAFSIRNLALYSGILGLAAALFHGLQYPEHSAVPAEFVELPAPGEEFSHPYDSQSAFFKAFIRFKRFVFLTFLFVPCACVGAMVHFTNDKKWREYWLDLLVRTFESAGCGFQKFGQWISMRPDMFPADVVTAMGKLRQNVPPHDIRHTRRMIRESFGADIDELFESFEETPVASGTVAQVHHARLRPEHAINGQVRDVAVKVRHPSVLEETFADIEFIFHIVDNTTFMAVPFSKDQFLKSLQKQVNFEWEAHALSKFASNFKEEIKRGEVCFPVVSDTLLSPCVLVEQWVSGTTVANFFSEVGFGFKTVGEQIGSVVESQKQHLADSLFSVCMKMFLRDNYMHGDLHAGNVIFDEKRGILTVLDAGHTTSLRPDTAPYFGQFMSGMCTGNPDYIVKSLLAFHDPAASNKSIDIEGLNRDVRAACKRWVAPNGRAPDGSPVCVGDLMGDIFFHLARNNVSLRGDVAISLVSIAVSEGLIRQLAPDFDMNKKALPYIARFGTNLAA
eukprot:c11693_g1_i1.p1 GENE.c11693_g1_i1~~c11693_g1_i1.p1  ORF type:complete len:602 (-),score=99.62 c11693_g1_i1:1297-3102(-)